MSPHMDASIIFARWSSAVVERKKDGMRNKSFNNKIENFRKLFQTCALSKMLISISYTANRKVVS